MALIFHRRLATPLWAIAFFATVLAAPLPATVLLMPPTTLFVIALAGIAVLAMRGAFPWWRPSRSLALVKPPIQRAKASAGAALDGGLCVRTLEEPNGHTAADALDLVRMDDDGG